jgi:hypothetical protein
VLARKLYQELGYASMELYAAEALGFSPNRTSQFLKLARDLDRLPPLKEAVAQGRLEWTKAQQVGRIASPRTAERWVEAAEKSSRRELAQKVKAAKLAQERRRSGQQELELAGAAEAEPLPAPRVAVKLSFDSLDAAQLEAMIEAAKKAGLVPATATREEAILAAMGALLEGGALRRRNAATHYKVVLYRCEACQSTEVVTGSGRRRSTLRQRRRWSRTPRSTIKAGTATRSLLPYARRSWPATAIAAGRRGAGQHASSRSTTDNPAPREAPTRSRT